MFSSKSKNSNVITDERNFSDQHIKDGMKTYENIRKIVTSQRDDYTTGCLLGYLYFKENYEMIVIDLYKQQALDLDPKVIQQINFAGNLDQAGYILPFFIYEEAKKLFRLFHKDL